MNEIAVFLDYSVLDHLFRLKTSRGEGLHGMDLTNLKRRAETHEIVPWMSEITKVEMLLGIQNEQIPVAKRAQCEEADHAKLRIAESMGVQWLTYPCSKFEDKYSRLDLSFRCAGPDWPAARALEESLTKERGIGPKGDPRQIVSCLLGRDTLNLGRRPDIRWFIAEDGDLVTVLRKLQIDKGIIELVGLQIGTSVDFAAGFESNMPSCNERA